jgi:hypothetical protein
VAWLLPELEVGVELELKPLELVEPVESLDEDVDFDEPVLELPEVLELEPVLELDEPVLVLEDDDVLVAAVSWVDPGRARATAPAATALATVTPAVVARTRARPRFRAATASRTFLLIHPIVGSRISSRLRARSQFALKLGRLW